MLKIDNQSLNNKLSTDIVETFNVHQKVPLNMRMLVRRDLERCIIISNRNLIKQIHIDKKYLLNHDKLKDLIQNTEQTMYTYYGNDLLKYIETFLTILIFLTDKQLSLDALLFRLLINIDFKDILLDPNIEEILFSELFYSNADPIVKKNFITNIANQISQRIYALLHDYLRGQQFVSIASLQYVLPKELKRNMDTYRSTKINDILSRFDKPLKHDLYSDDSSIGDDVDLFSSMFSDSESKSRSRSRSPGSRISRTSESSLIRENNSNDGNDSNNDSNDGNDSDSSSHSPFINDSPQKDLNSNHSNAFTNIFESNDNEQKILLNEEPNEEPDELDEPQNKELDELDELNELDELDDQDELNDPDDQDELNDPDKLRESDDSSTSEDNMNSSNNDSNDNELDDEDNELNDSTDLDSSLIEEEMMAAAKKNKDSDSDDNNDNANSTSTTKSKRKKKAKILAKAASTTKGLTSPLKGSKIMCDYCKIKEFTHSYKTPIIYYNTPVIRYFCSPECMENWSPKK